MLDLFEQISNLSNYSFELGIANSTIEIKLNDDETALSSDFLKMLEYGSPLHNIFATRPIERTWLTMKDMMLTEYENCIDLIIKYDVKRQVIDERMRNLARLLQLRLQHFVKNDMKSEIVCLLFYKGVKIN